MKKILSIVGATVFVASIATLSFGQAAGPQGAGAGIAGQGQNAGQQGHGKGGKLMAEALQSLNLSDAQKAQIKQLGEKFRADMKALKGDPAVKEKRQALAKEHREAVMKILTPEQRRKLQAFLKEHRKENAAGAKAGRGGVKGGGGGL